MRPAAVLFLATALSVGGVRLLAEERPPDEPTRPSTAHKATTPTAPSTAAPSAPQKGPKEQGEAPGFIRMLGKGGKTMYFLAALSIMGGAAALERLFRLRRSAIVPDGLAREADELWQSGQFDHAEALYHEKPSTLSRVVAFIVAHRESPVGDVSRGAADLAATELKRHLQKAYPLAVVATLSPLLGLLGTVFGMIEAFQMVAIAGALGDATLLADGISKALVTTAAGLVIAIPTLGLYHYFKSRTTLYAIMLEEQVTELISRWLMKRTASHAD